MEQREGHVRNHRNSGKKTLKSVLKSLEGFLFNYILVIIGIMLIVAGAIYWFFSGKANVYLAKYDIIHNHVNYAGLVSSPFFLPLILIWFVLTVSGLAVFKPRFHRKISSRLWDSLSYSAGLILLILSSIMIWFTGLKPIYPVCFFGTFLVLTVLAVLNERFDFLKNKRPFLYLLCICGAFLSPFLLTTHFLIILAGSLSVATLINSYMIRSRKSLIISQAFFYIMTALFIYEMAFLFKDLVNMDQGDEIYPRHILLSFTLVSSMSYFYVRLNSYIVAKYPFLQLKSLLPADIPERILPFLIYLTIFVLFDYLLLNIIPGYLPNLIEIAFITLSILWLINIFKPSINRPAIIFRAALSLIIIAIYPLVINPEVNNYRDLLSEGRAGSLIPFSMHYGCLIVMMLLLLQTNGLIRKLYHGTTSTRHFRNLMVILLASFMILTEFDNLSLLLFSKYFRMVPQEIAISNKLFPYSIILLSIAIFLLFLSLKRHSIFMRRIAYSILVISILKIFSLDLKILKGDTAIILLISIGIILLGASFFARRTGKKIKHSGHRTKHKSHSEKNNLSANQD